MLRSWVREFFLLNKLMYGRYLLHEFSLTLRITRGGKLYFIRLDVVDVE